MTQIFNTILETALDSNGNPISGAQLFIYEAGTTTKLTTFSDSALTTANANPLIADSAGRFATIYGNPDEYKFVLTTATDTDPPTSPIQTTDNYTIAATSSFSGGINAGGFTEHLTNAQTGTSYTILTGDRSKLVTLDNPAAVSVTLPQAVSVTFPDGWYVTVEDIGAGATTITPTTSTINGAATLVLATNESAFIVSDGTNYRATLVSRRRDSVVTTVTSTSNATTIDLNDSDVFQHTFTENTTFTFSNPSPTGFNSGFKFFLTQDGTGRTPTWPGSVIWSEGVEPTLTGINKKYVLVFETIDGGTIYYGALSISEAA